MKCSTVHIAGATAIVCGRDRIYHCIVCGAPAHKLCDWKLGPKRTCDRPICDIHATSPAPGKDLCLSHATQWAAHPGAGHMSRGGVTEGHYVPTMRYVTPRWVLRVTATHVYYSRHGNLHYFCRIETFRQWLTRAKTIKEPA